MKVLITLLCLSMASASWAAKKESESTESSKSAYGMAGCGLGSMVFKDKGTFGQTCAATTNGSFYNQFFAISSGTSNCTPTNDQIAQLEFINTNLASLQREIAQGDGETLTAFSQVLGCDSSVYPTLANQLKTKHGQIFANPGTVSVWSATLDSVRQNTVLKQSCQKLS